MTDAELTQAMAELQEVVRCRCHEAYRDRGLHDPQCECDSAEAVKIVADRIEALTEQLAAARQDAEEAEAYAGELEVNLATAVELALKECPFRWGTPRYDKWWQDRRTIIAELTRGKDE